MIQDIAPHHYDNTYRPAAPQADDYALFFEPGTALMQVRNDQIQFPTFRDLEKCQPDVYQDATYLFQVDEHRFYLIHHMNTAAFMNATADTSETSGLSFTMESTQSFRLCDPKYLAFAGITAYQLYQWYDIRRFCGRCGAPMRRHEKERMMYCDHCHNAEYPKLSPAVIIALTHNNRLLLSKYAGRTYTRYALLAGFVEIGETVEETVRREVMEEVGLPVKNIRYYKSQPWSFSSSVLMGFYCDLDGDNETITLDEEELALAHWFEREEIPVKATRDSLTNEMIMTFIRGEEPQ